MTVPGLVLDEPRPVSTSIVCPWERTR